MPTTRLVRCDTCKRVYDASSLRESAAFACHCGARLTVRALRMHDSPVIRCSACGASRAPNASECSFCKAVFTIRERDLTGMCAACGSRTASNDHYCHACGAVLVPSEQAATPGDKACPVCNRGHMLSHRDLSDVPLLECKQCGGVWLDRASFSTLAHRVSSQAKRSGFSETRGMPRDVAPQLGPTYRRCIECNTSMLRKNYGTKSGVIVDICARHGTWFDALELDAVLAWLRAGGEVMPTPKAAQIDPSQARAIIAAATAPPPQHTAWEVLVDLLDTVFGR